MKTTAIIKAIALLFFSLFFMVASSQQESDKKTSEPQEFVINMKMIERFNASNAEVIPWAEVLLQRNFEGVKKYINAYNNINLNSINSSSINLAIKEKLKEEVESQPNKINKYSPIALNSSINN
jgi:hypothetical protein